MAKEPNWSSEELKVLDRFVSGLRDHRFASRREAAVECWRQLKRLRPRAQRGGPFAVRSRPAVLTRLSVRAQAAGIPPSQAPWQPGELEILDRYLALVVARRYGSAHEAAVPCWRELRRRGFGKRTLGAVRIRMILRARAGNLRWPGVYWCAAERAVVRRHARKMLKSGGRSVRSVVLACQRDLKRLPVVDRAGLPQRPPDGRSYLSVYDHLRTMAHVLGWSWQHRSWQAWESRVLRRYARALIEGRFSDAPTASEACRLELARLARVRQGDEQRPPRTAYGIALRMKEMVARTRLARNRSKISRTEMRTVERYARAVDRGGYHNWKDAARACVDVLNRRANAAAARSPLRVRRAKGHSAHTVYTRILDVAHRLKLRGPRCIRWTDDEDRICASWMRWYDRHRLALRHRGVWTETLSGMQEELENAGFSRSLSGCECRMQKLRMRAEGMT